MAQISEQQKVLLGIAIVFVLFLLGSFIYQHYFETGPTKIRQCDAAHDTCTVVLANRGNVSLTVAPKTMAQGVPIHFTVKINQLLAQTVDLDVLSDTAPTCNTQVIMNRQDSGLYTARLSLPSCAPGTQRWIFIVRLSSGNISYAIPFRMTAQSLS